MRMSPSVPPAPIARGQRWRWADPGGQLMYWFSCGHVASPVGDIELPAAVACEYFEKPVAHHGYIEALFLCRRAADRVAAGRHGIDERLAREQHGATRVGVAGPALIGLARVLQQVEECPRERLKRRGGDLTLVEKLHR